VAVQVDLVLAGGPLDAGDDVLQLHRKELHPAQLDHVVGAAGEPGDARVR
jgi:hypothetical protein